MEVSFAGSRALVTGAGKGIGRAIARALWENGATVYALSRTQSDLDSLQEECPGIEIVNVDLQNWKETQDAVQRVGRVDLLVNNAAVNRIMSVLDVSEDIFDEVIAINVKAVVNVTQIVARGMVERKRGSIVNISSVLSKMAMKSWCAYCASKAALDQLTRCQAVELGPHQIRVNAINSTAVDTPMFRASRVASPDIVNAVIDRTATKQPAEVKDNVNLILYLLSDKADMVNGAIIPVDGGSWCS